MTHDAPDAHLHRAPCPVPMWEMVGRHYGRPRPACTCGADRVTHGGDEERRCPECGDPWYGVSHAACRDAAR